MYIQDSGGYKGRPLAIVEDNGETFVVVRWLEYEGGESRNFLTVELVENIEIGYAPQEKAAIIAEMLK